MGRGALARSLIAFSVTLLAAKNASAALQLALWGIALGVIGILASIGIVLATDDGSPEIGPIQIVVDNSEPGDWYVGQLRVVTVETEVSFGHIRGTDVGTITLELDVNGDVEDRQPRRYTEKDDNDPDTITLDRWEGIITFGVEVEAKTEGSVTIGAKITVDGESDGLYSDSAVTVSKIESRTVDFLYPLELQSVSEAIGWLDPHKETITHVQCFDQSLEVRNRATVHGQVGEGTISRSTADSVPFAAASTNSSAAVTEIVEGSVGHENSVVHWNSVYFETGWSLEGTDNIRLFLESESEWSDGGGRGPSSQSNTCDGGTGNCTLIDIHDAPVVRDVDTTYVVEILARNQPRRAASSRQVLLTDTSGLSKSHTTNSSGEFTISESALGPLVGLNLVVGSDAALFEPKSLVGVNVELFDSDVSPTFQSFSIMEAEAPSVQGNAIDGLGNPVRTDLFAVDDEGEETFLGRFTGPISIPGGLDLSTVGYPEAKFRVKPLPAFNRDYQVAKLDVVLSSDVEVIDLGILLFEEREPFEGPVTFRGTFEIRGPDGVLAYPGAGLSLWIEGVGTVVTGSGGEFEVVVPAGVAPRTVGFSDPPDLATAGGDPLNLPEQTESEIEFGRNGTAVLDLGVVTLHAQVAPPEVPLLDPAALGALVTLLAGAGLFFARRRIGRAAAA